MRVLVTGATGFVGSHCIEALTDDEDVETIAACREPSRLPDNFKGEKKIGDLRDKNYLDHLMKGVAVVIHAAAWTSLWNHKRQSEKLFLRPSLDLIDAARRQGVKRLIFISAVSVAAPHNADDPMSKGTKRTYWPHEANVVTIEERLREIAGEDFCAVSLRLGLFAGSRYALGLLPILVPRLRTHLVPWVCRGRTSLPIIDGRDVGACAALAATAPGLKNYEGFNVVGPEIPRVREVIDYLHHHHGLPRPHFSVPFPVAFAFAWLMEKLDPILPWEPLVTRSIVHLLQESAADNTRAERKLGYRPKHHWKETIDLQLAEMARRKTKKMAMARPIIQG